MLAHPTLLALAISGVVAALVYILVLRVEKREGSPPHRVYGEKTRPRRLPQRRP
jgi:hypothetical protein